ncbi:MAG: SAM-dependent methyltransferase [Phycisphaerae bacterium]
MPTEQQNWDQRYQQQDTPWDAGRPCEELARVLDEYAIPPGRVLEPGCGTGADCVYLASRGFDVLGIDIAPTAIMAAEKRALDAGVRCRFTVADVFNLPDIGTEFPFIYDRGCYHVARQTDEAALVDVYDKLLAPGGLLLVLTGSSNEQNPPNSGPPRVSEEELRRAFSPGFKIVHLRECRLETQPGRNFSPLAWSLLLRKV